jgi:hypothetical protein
MFPSPDGEQSQINSYMSIESAKQVRIRKMASDAGKLANVRFGWKADIPRSTSQELAEGPVRHG